jgi:hypothetical protein
VDYSLNCHQSVGSRPFRWDFIGGEAGISSARLTNHYTQRGIVNEFGNYFGVDLGVVAVTAVTLLAFGAAYNWLVGQLTRRGHTDGYTWLLVVVGVLVTIVAAGFTIGWAAVILLGIYFVASGLPMAAGDIWRHVAARRAENGDDD